MINSHHATTAVSGNLNLVMNTVKTEHQQLSDANQILSDLLTSKKSVSRRKFLRLISRFGGFNHWRLGDLFAWDSYFVVLPDNRERSLSRFVREKDNHGYCTHAFYIKDVIRLQWKYIYCRPSDLSTRQAFALAEEFRRSDGKVRLSRHVRRLYRYTLVGRAEDKMTFPEFCRLVNGVSPAKPKQLEASAAA